MQKLSAMMFAGVLAMVMMASAARADVALPEQAVGPKTAVAIWVDVEQLQPASLQAAAEAINSVLPADMAVPKEQLMAQMQQQLDKFKQQHNAYLEAGGKGLLVLVNEPEEGQQPQEPSMLVNVKPGTTAEGLQAAMVEAGVKEDAALAAYSDQWLVSTEHGVVPENGTAADATAFQTILTQAGNAPVRIAFRVSDTMKKQMAEQAQTGAAGPMAGLVGPLQSLSTGWSTVSFGQQPKIVTQLNFADDQAAQQFNATWDGLLMMGQGMLAAQLSQGPQAPRPEAIQGMFNSLKMAQQGSALSVTLDQGFVGHTAEVAAPMLGMFMMGMQQQMAPVQMGE